MVARCVYEADVGLTTNLEVCGIFDTSKWAVGDLEDAADIDTSQSQVCMCLCLMGMQCLLRQVAEKDQAMLTKIIKDHGSFKRLDNAITELRGQTMGDLKAAMQIDMMCAHPPLEYE